MKGKHSPLSLLLLFFFLFSSFIILVKTETKKEQIGWIECELGDEPEMKFAFHFPTPGAIPVVVNIESATINTHEPKLGSTLISTIQGTVKNGTIKSAQLKVSLGLADKTKKHEKFTLNYELCTKLKRGTKQCPLKAGDVFTVDLEAHLILVPRELINQNLILSGIVHESV